jgi:cytoskeletal protein RodZ
MDSLGQQLKSRREAQGIRLEEIAAATKIGKRFLEALEADDFDSLPGDVFAKGFVRAFAQHIGAEPEEMVDAWERQRSGESDATVADDDKVIREMSRLLDHPEDRAEPAGRRATLIWLAVGAAIVAGAAWLVVPPTDPTPPAPEPAAPAAQISVESRPVTDAERKPVEAPVLPAATPIEEEPPPATVVAEPEPEPVEAAPVVPEPEPVVAQRLEVVEYAVGTDVRNRRIVGAGDRFEAGGQVSFWTRITGGEPGEAIRHVWLHEGRVVQTIELELGGSHWRTYSRKTLWYTGHWSVEVQDAAGRVLARSEFDAN